MGLHRLTAGAGYQYLLKHTASGDCDRSGTQPLVAYYTESGNPPGRWLGNGLASLSDVSGTGSLTPGTVVTEEAMGNLFGAGHHPVTGTLLGRPYPKVVPVAERIAAAVAKLPPDMSAEARQAAQETIAKVEMARPVPRAVAGFDLTFTPPKSVSTLWALADGRTRPRPRRCSPGSAPLWSTRSLLQAEVSKTPLREYAKGCDGVRTDGGPTRNEGLTDQVIRSTLPSYE